jgi:hypothetical protein
MLLYLNIEQDEALLKAGVNSGVQIGSWTPVLLYLTIDSNTQPSKNREWIQVYRNVPEPTV